VKDPQLDIDLTAGDFLEGGVELPRAPEEDEDGRYSVFRDDEGGIWRLPQTEPLPALADAGLQEFWPPRSEEGPRALFLDYDGTLWDGAERQVQPVEDDAMPTPMRELKELLAKIEQREDLVPHLISRRSRAFLETHFGSLGRFTLVAECGHQIRRPNSSWESWERHPVRSLDFEEESPTSPCRRDARKGPAMRRLCEEKSLFGAPFLAVLVSGGDISDESMFDSAPPDFLTIKVGPAQTHARFRVDTLGQLHDFLWGLVSRESAA
jgi:hypothetical protein